MTSPDPPKAASGSPPPTIFPRMVRSGLTRSAPARRRARTRKPVITSSKTSSAPDASQSARSASRNPGNGGTQPHVPGHRLDEDRSKIFAVALDRSRDLVDVVVVDDDRVVDDGLRHSG